MQKLLGLILWFGSFIWAVVSIFSHMVEKQDLNIGHLICFVLLMLVSGMGRRIFFIRSVLIQGVGFGSAISSRIFCSRLLRSIFYYSSVAVFIYFINRLYVYMIGTPDDGEVLTAIILGFISLVVCTVLYQTVKKSCPRCGCALNRYATTSNDKYELKLYRDHGLFQEELTEYYHCPRCGCRVNTKGYNTKIIK